LDLSKAGQNAALRVRTSAEFVSNILPGEVEDAEREKPFPNE